MDVNIEKIRREKPIEELIKFSIINLDKPSGPTSFMVDVHIKRALNLNKTSHFGTLDPLVTGVLPIGLGRACRLLDYFMHKNKKYLGIMRIHNEIKIDDLKKVIETFLGKIKQTPPLRSRVKRQEREREVHSFDILEVDENGKDFLFETEVQAGTYIRKLISDMGEKIGGAHMLELRRVKAGMFEDKNSELWKFVNLYDFDNAVAEWKENHNEKPFRELLIPAEIVSRLMPVVFVDKRHLGDLYKGKMLKKESCIDCGEYDKWKEKEVFCAFSENTLIGIYEAISNKKARARFVYN